MVMQIDRNGVGQMLGTGAQLVDVLSSKEYEAEHIAGAINIPLKTLGRETVRRLDRDRTVIVYCHDYQWDLSARAAARLERLAFKHVYRYQPGKADWFAAGLPREGREAGTPRVADVALHDVPTCRIDENVRAVQDRITHGRWNVCVVVDDQHVVLGVVVPDSIKVDPGTSVEQVMDSAPVTFRPHIPAGTLPEYVKTQRVSRALVTTSDGVLIGLLPIE